jgi:flavin prenyltransferase
MWYTSVMSPSNRLVVAITGSSGAALGIRLLQALRDSEIETHLILSPAARLTIAQETPLSAEQVEALADVVYPYRDIGAALASGSFATRGMVVIPCSIKTLSAVANSYSSDLISRAADVTLKEGRPLLLVVRETPLHRGHLRLMDLAARAGAIIFPPVPVFYAHPASIDDVVGGLVGRVLARLGIDNDLYSEWQGKVEPENAWAEFLAQPVLTLATSGADGAAHAAAVYFASGEMNTVDQNPDLESLVLYFFSEATAQHCADLQHNPRAAAEIHPPAATWQQIRGLQLRGQVRKVQPGPEWDAAWELYRAKFPFVAELKEVVVRNTLYAFTPAWLRLIDNRRGFGHKEEYPSA